MHHDIAGLPRTLLRDRLQKKAKKIPSNRESSALGGAVQGPTWNERIPTAFACSVPNRCLRNYGVLCTKYEYVLSRKLDDAR